MRILMERARHYAPAVILMSLLSSAGFSADNVGFHPLSREIIESRLGKYAGDNKKREATLKEMFSDVNVDQAASSDAEQFAERKIPRITIHSISQETWDARILHTSKDKLSAMHLDDYYQTYRLVAAYVVFLDHIAGNPALQTKH